MMKEIKQMLLEMEINENQIFSYGEKKAKENLEKQE